VVPDVDGVAGRGRRRATRGGVGRAGRRPHGVSPGGCSRRAEPCGPPQEPGRARTGVGPAASRRRSSESCRRRSATRAAGAPADPAASARAPPRAVDGGGRARCERRAHGPVRHSRRARQLRLVLGMVRANRPWRLVAGLSRAVVAARRAFGMVSTRVWKVAYRLFWWRLLLMCAAAVAVAWVALIVWHELWERSPSPAAASASCASTSRPRSPSPSAC
jgi:hypothetical protein